MTTALNQLTVCHNCKMLADRSYEFYRDQPSMIDHIVRFDNEAERTAFVARFPKWVKVKVYPGRRDYDLGIDTFCVAFRVSLHADGVTGAANETGIKRIRKYAELANDLLIDAKICNSLNGYTHIDEFLAAL